MRTLLPFMIIKNSYNQFIIKKLIIISRVRQLFAIADPVLLFLKFCWCIKMLQRPRAFITSLSAANFDEKIRQKHLKHAQTAMNLRPDKSANPDGDRLYELNTSYTIRKDVQILQDEIDQVSTYSFTLGWLVLIERWAGMSLSSKYPLIQSLKFTYKFSSDWFFDDDSSVQPSC